MKRRKHATEILRAHVCERHLIAHPAAQNIGDDKSPRMPPSAWAQSCIMVRGVPESTLKLLEVLYTGRIECRISPVDLTCYECGVPAGGRGTANFPRCGDSWRKHTMEDSDSTELRPFAKDLTLKQAAARAGWDIEDAKKAIDQAEDQVWSNMVGKAEAA